MALFASRKGLSMTHIPYRGSAPAMLDLVGGRFGVKVVDASTAQPFIQSGAVRPIVTVSTQRRPACPTCRRRSNRAKRRSRSTRR